MVQLLDPKEQCSPTLNLKCQIGSSASKNPLLLVVPSARLEIQNGKVTIDHINVRRYVKGRSECKTGNHHTTQQSLFQCVKTMEWVRSCSRICKYAEMIPDFYKHHI